MQTFQDDTPPKIIRVIEIEAPDINAPPLYQVIEIDAKSEDETELYADRNPGHARSAAYHHALTTYATLVIDRKVVQALELQHLEHMRQTEREMSAIPF
jgi:hypothetical protein